VRTVHVHLHAARALVIFQKFLRDDHPQIKTARENLKSLLA
jgi:hypothetical protein